jgi:hypothetical protein
MTTLAELNRKIMISEVINNFLVGRRKRCEFSKNIAKSSV